MNSGDYHPGLPSSHSCALSASETHGRDITAGHMVISIQDPTFENKTLVVLWDIFWVNGKKNLCQLSDLRLWESVTRCELNCLRLRGLSIGAYTDDSISKSLLFPGSLEENCPSLFGGGGGEGWGGCLLRHGALTSRLPDGNLAPSQRCRWKENERERERERERDREREKGSEREPGKEHQGVFLSRLYFRWHCCVCRQTRPWNSLNCYSSQGGSIVTGDSRRWAYVLCLAQ